MSRELLPFLDELAVPLQALIKQQLKVVILKVLKIFFGQSYPDSNPTNDVHHSIHVLIAVLQPFKYQLYAYLTELNPFMTQLSESSFRFCQQNSIGWNQGIQPLIKTVIPFCVTQNLDH